MSDQGADLKTETVVHQTSKKTGNPKQNSRHRKTQTCKLMLVLLRMQAKESLSKIDKTTISTLRLTPVTPGVQSPVSLWHMMEKMPILIFRQRYLIVGQS